MTDALAWCYCGLTAALLLRLVASRVGFIYPAFSGYLIVSLIGTTAWIIEAPGHRWIGILAVAVLAAAVAEVFLMLMTFLPRRHAIYAAGAATGVALVVISMIAGELPLQRGMSLQVLEQWRRGIIIFLGVWVATLLILIGFRPIETSAPYYRRARNHTLLIAALLWARIAGYVPVPQDLQQWTSASAMVLASQCCIIACWFALTRRMPPAN